MPFHLAITPGGDTPIYRQIAEGVRRAILAGKVAPGDPLPSVRALAEELVVNPNTVMRAFADLAREGLVDAQPGRGFFIAERRQPYSRTERERRLRAAVETFVHAIAFLDFKPAEVLAPLRERLEGTEVQHNRGRKDES